MYLVWLGMLLNELDTRGSFVALYTKDNSFGFQFFSTVY